MLETELNPKSEFWFSNVEEPKIVTDASAVNWDDEADLVVVGLGCLLYTSPSPRDLSTSRMPSSA